MSTAAGLLLPSAPARRLAATSRSSPPSSSPTPADVALARMRIGKHAATILSSLSIPTQSFVAAAAAAGDRELEMHVCQLNQSPWDAMDFTPLGSVSFFPYQAKLDSAALRLGLVGNICCAFLCFPVTRGSSLLPLAGLTSEGSIKYHIWLGHTVMVFFSTHGLCYVVFWASTNSLSSMLEWDKKGVSNVAGELALLCGLALWVTTFPAVRRKAFEVFFYTHQLYTLFLLFFLLHVGISFFCYILPGIYLFLLDPDFRIRILTQIRN